MADHKPLTYAELDAHTGKLSRSGCIANVVAGMIRGATEEAAHDALPARVAARWAVSILAELREHADRASEWLNSRAPSDPEGE